MVPKEPDVKYEEDTKSGRGPELPEGKAHVEPFEGPQAEAMADPLPDPELTLPWFSPLKTLYPSFYVQLGFARAITGDINPFPAPQAAPAAEHDDNGLFHAFVNQGAREFAPPLSPRQATRRYRACCCCFHSRGCAQILGVVALLSLLYTVIFIFQTNFHGPLAALQQPGALDRALEGFPENLEVQWNYKNRSLTWWRDDGAKSAPPPGSPGEGYVEIGLPWEYMMMWVEDLPFPLFLTPVGILDFVAALLLGPEGINDGRNMFADDLVRTYEFKVGEEVLVKSDSPIYGGVWTKGRITHCNFSEDLGKISYTVLHENGKQVNVDPFHLRYEHSKLVFIGHENMDYRAIRSEDGHGAYGVDTGGGFEGEGETGEHATAGEGEREGEGENEGEGGGDVEELGILMDHWQSMKSLVVITERRLHLFQGFSFRNRGYWQFPFAKMPKVSQLLRRSAPNHYKPLSFLVDLFCETDVMMLPTVDCRPGDEVKATYEPNQIRYAAELESWEELRGEAMWKVKWEDDDEEHRHVRPYLVYKNGFPCKPLPPSENFEEGVVEGVEESDKEKVEEEAVYEPVLHCKRSIAKGKIDNRVGEVGKKALEWGLHIIVFDLITYVVIFGYTLFRHIFLFFVVQLPLAFAAVNLLRHVDTPVAPWSVVCVLGMYAVVPLIIAREAITILVQALKFLYGDQFSVKMPMMYAFINWYSETKYIWMHLSFVFWMAFLVYHLRSEAERRFTAARAARIAAEERVRDDHKDKKKNIESDEDEAVCRICYGGPEYGRLISPCLCRGSIRFVHLQCLQQWRHASPSSRAFYECDMCKYRYSFKRAFYAQICRSAVVLHIISLQMLIGMVVIISLVLRAVDVNIASGAMTRALKPDIEAMKKEFEENGQFVLKEDFYDSLESFFESTWLFGLGTPHLLLGVVAVGVVGWLCSFWLYAPLIWGPDRNRNVLPFLVIIGVFKVLTMTYGFVKRLSGFYLQAAENLILEVGEGYQPRAPRPGEGREVEADRGPVEGKDGAEGSTSPKHNVNEAHDHAGNDTSATQQPPITNSTATPAGLDQSDEQKELNR
ncbi:hypothetical protein AAMO2058_000184400 [Amorphochlora amoebiformis]